MELDVTCPEDALPGTSLQVNTPDGLLNVTVPEGVAPGDTFRITLPELSGPELEPRDPMSDAPGGLQALAAEIAGERAIVASFFGNDAVEVKGGDVLAEAIRAVLRSISRIDALDELIDGQCSRFAEWDASAEQDLSLTPIFNDYVSLAEAGISEALDELECSDAELFDYARCYHAESAESERLLSRLLAFSDYASFAKMMREAHARGGTMSC